MREQRLSKATIGHTARCVAWEASRVGAPSSFIVVRVGEGWAAYQNLCPHWRIPLSSVDDGIYNDARGYLVCSSHAAVFRTRDGQCVSGPCEGEGLTPLRVEEQGDWLVIRETSGLSICGLDGLDGPSLDVEESADV